MAGKTAATVPTKNKTAPKTLLGGQTRLDAALRPAVGTQALDPLTDEYLLAVHGESATMQILLTPELAQQLLDSQYAGNRKIRKARLDQMIRDHLADNVQCGESDSNIALDWFDRMINGQHRCRTVVETGKPMLVWVTVGVDPREFHHQDRGIVRTFVDCVKAEGQKYSGKKGAAAALCLQYEANNFKFQPTNDEKIVYYKANPGMSKWGDYVGGETRRKSFYPFTDSAVIASGYLFERVHGEKAWIFWEHYQEGVNMPIQVEVLATWAGRGNVRSSHNTRLATWIQLGYMFKALNAYVTGTEMKAINFITSGKRPESFPRIAGEEIPDTFPAEWEETESGLAVPSGS